MKILKNKVRVRIITITVLCALTSIIIVYNTYFEKLSKDVAEIQYVLEKMNNFNQN